MMVCRYWRCAAGFPRGRPQRCLGSRGSRQERRSPDGFPDKRGLGLTGSRDIGLLTCCDQRFGPGEQFWPVSHDRQSMAGTGRENALRGVWSAMESIGCYDADIETQSLPG
jgi:hypothetical protein